MDEQGMKYEFAAKVYHHSSSPELAGWMFVKLPKELLREIRKLFKELEEGWGRMRVSVKTGDSQWKTSIWFDTKQDRYLLPIKAAIRKKEKIVKDALVEIAIWINV
ncbi:DUF1905 domain-containing protein [Enterococcus sp. DIV0756]|uniref:DUF1905 domain-containing protein n=1 Tax=Enterococcus sp. DIV0756 TaxID=2774636 RepID=UPI003F26F285